MLTFNKHGHLTPDQPIESTLEELEVTFVFNDRRRLIFNQMLEFLDEMNLLIPSDFLIWIDGSFVTKKERPGDLDCVLFADYKFYEIHEEKLSALRKAFAPLLDVYFVKVFPEDNPRSSWSESDRVEYLALFSKSRENKKKGFLQLNFLENGKD